jgi:hypothetical protein
MSPVTAEICWETRGETESTRHSQEGDIASQRVRRHPIGQPGQLRGHVAGAVELARGHRVDAVAAGEHPHLGTRDAPPVAQQLPATSVTAWHGDLCRLMCWQKLCCHGSKTAIRIECYCLLAAT